MTSSSAPGNAQPGSASTAYVVDTHALVWRLTGDPRLSPGATAIFNAAERGDVTLLLSAIVVAELYYLNRKHHYLDFTGTMHWLMAAPYVHLVAFTVEHAIDLEHDEVVPEMHDRIIAGIARRLKVPVLTRDPFITRSGVAQIAW